MYSCRQDNTALHGCYGVFTPWAEVKIISALNQALFRQNQPNEQNQFCTVLLFCPRVTENLQLLRIWTRSRHPVYTLYASRPESVNLAA